MIEIVVTEAEVVVSNWPVVPGGKVLIFKTKTGIQVSVPMDENAARIVAAGLTSGIIIANPLQIPKQ
jgi:hypothetical protein